MAVVKLTYEQWLEMFKFVPRVAVDLVVEKKGKLMLTRRKREPFAGSWHLPGSFVMKGETLAECAQRVARDELGTNVKEMKSSSVWENLAGDPRGHIIDVGYRCVLEGEPKAVGDTAEVGWFDKLPDNIGFGQAELIRELDF